MKLRAENQTCCSIPKAYNVVLKSHFPLLFWKTHSKCLWTGFHWKASSFTHNYYLHYCTLCYLSAPSNAPSNISRTEINDTTFLLQWRPIPRHESNGNVTKYEVRSIMTSRGRTHRTKRSVVYGTRNAFTGEPWYILTGLLSCAQYNISVRGYTTAGHGPYSTPINVNTSRESFNWNL